MCMVRQIWDSGMFIRLLLLSLLQRPLLLLRSFFPIGTNTKHRRTRQLFLNQRRYDALVRNVWLNHGIPSVISRKLEAELNTGGWDSL
jgi:hypothetical protein